MKTLILLSIVLSTSSLFAGVAREVKLNGIVKSLNDKAVVVEVKNCNFMTLPRKHVSKKLKLKVGKPITFVALNDEIKLTSLEILKKLSEK